MPQQIVASDEAGHNKINLALLLTYKTIKRLHSHSHPMHVPQGADYALNVLNGHFKRVNKLYEDTEGFLVNTEKLMFGGHFNKSSQ